MGFRTPAAARSKRARAFVLACLWPLLVLVQALGGQVALFHAHDEHGQHVHFVTQAGTTSLSQEHGHAPAEASAPATPTRSEPLDGTSVELPEVLATRACAHADDVERAAVANLAPALLAVEIEHDSRHRRALDRPPDPSRLLRHRSGIAWLPGSQRSLRI